MGARSEIANDLSDAWILDLWEAAPTPEKAAHVPKKAIARILKSHRIRRFDATQVISELRKPAVNVAQGTTEAATAHIRVVIEQLRLVNRQLVDAERQLDRLCKKLAEPVGGEDGESVSGQRQEHRDVTILDSLPGVGRIVLATMLAEASDALQRRDYHALRTLCGSAPVTRRSGKSCIVMRRLACNRRLTNAAFQLGTHRDPERCHKPCQVRRPQSSRSRSRPRDSLGRRPVALCRLHHAGKPNFVRPFIAQKRNSSSVIRRAGTH